MARLARWGVLSRRDQYLLAPSRPPHLEASFPPAPTPWAPPLSPEAYRRLPLMAWAELLQPVARDLADYLRHPHDGPPWWQLNIERQHGEIAVPMYHVTSWYDIFLHGGIANFRGHRPLGHQPRFLPGHRIGVEISSRNFPRFDRNLNTGEDPATGTRWQMARQTVLHDERSPSHILLSIIPR